MLYVSLANQTDQGAELKGLHGEEEIRGEVFEGERLEMEGLQRLFIG
jgi:hypothetical protein